MKPRLNTLEKKLKYHCSNCQSTWQLLVIRTDLFSDARTKCLNNCSQKWARTLITYCQEQIILDITRKEQQKDEKQPDLEHWLQQIRKQNNQK